MISKYNTLTGQAVSTDLNEYVTNETINGVFKMVAEKESGIRNNSVMRTTSILQKVLERRIVNSFSFSLEKIN
ncbi:DUF4197 family protein [Chryseobacterium indoltheticum]|uniref:DUF4197 family protein n=1 Tax=Chryseobacterium indoltheticum TaxID=254 RepID=UPI003F4986BD